MQKPNAWNLRKHFKFALKSSRSAAFFVVRQALRLFFPIGSKPVEQKAFSRDLGPLWRLLILRCILLLMLHRGLLLLPIVELVNHVTDPHGHRVKLWTMQPPKKAMEEISRLKLIETPFEKKLNLISKKDFHQYFSRTISFSSPKNFGPKHLLQLLRSFRT